MPQATSHPPGTFCWIELATTDDRAARDFYTGLFGWSANEIPMGEMGTYYIFQKNGADCAAMYKIGPEMQGMPPNWASYVCVSDADATTEKAKSLGATVLNGPFDVYDFGRMSALADPQGAMFAIWQPKTHIGVTVRDEPNTLCWNELQVRDLDTAKRFYSALFGWKLKETPEYTEMSVGNNAIGGMMQSQAPPEVPSYWMPYFAVDDCEATVAKAQSAGATVYAPPFDVPNVGRMSVLGDPQGAVFAVIRLSLQAH